MSVFSAPLPPFMESLGMAMGFLISLIIFSFILRETILVRITQYLLVGVSLGYVVVITWHSVLWPRLLRPLLHDAPPPPASLPEPAALWLYWLPLVMGIVLLAAGVDYLWHGAGERWAAVSRWVRWLALIPVGIVIGVGLGVGIAGGLQGTIYPQSLRAAELGSAWLSAPDLLLGLLTLLITGGAILYLQIGDNTLGARFAPVPLRWLVQAWGWIGQRALWLAAGVLFARLFAARITLVLDRLIFILFDLRQSDLWTWLRAAFGGGLG